MPFKLTDAGLSEHVTVPDGVAQVRFTVPVKLLFEVRVSVSVPEPVEETDTVELDGVTEKSDSGFDKSRVVEDDA